MVIFLLISFWLSHSCLTQCVLKRTHEITFCVLSFLSDYLFPISKVKFENFFEQHKVYFD